MNKKTSQFLSELSTLMKRLCDATNPININKLSEYQEIAKWK